MCALNEQFDHNVFATIDQKLDLFPVVGESHSNTGRECFDTLNPGSPIRESIVGCKVLGVELGYPIDLSFSPDNVAGFSDNVSV